MHRIECPLSTTAVLQLAALLVLLAAHIKGFVLEAPFNGTVTDRYSVHFFATGVPKGCEICLWVAGYEIYENHKMCAQEVDGKFNYLVAFPIDEAWNREFTFHSQVECHGGGGDQGREIRSVMVRIVRPRAQPEVHATPPPAGTSAMPLEWSSPSLLPHQLQVFALDPEAHDQFYGSILSAAFQRRFRAARQRCACLGIDSSSSSPSLSSDVPPAVCEASAPGVRSLSAGGWRVNTKQFEWLRSRLFPDVYGGVFVEAGAADVFSSLTEDLERQFCWSGVGGKEEMQRNFCLCF